MRFKKSSGSKIKKTIRAKTVQISDSLGWPTIWTVLGLFFG